MIFQAIGGLGLFIFGMKLMSEGLQKVAGDRLRQFLEKSRPTGWWAASPARW